MPASVEAGAAWCSGGGAVKRRINPGARRGLLARAPLIPVCLDEHLIHGGKGQPVAIPQGFEALLDDAINGRQCPGEGGLPIAEMCAAIPNVPISFEVRSKALRENFSDDVERARHLLSF